MYSITEKDTKAKWICASNELLKNFDRKKANEFPDASFIWGWYTRLHFRRIFDVCDVPKSAKLHFLCDNVIDVYINGVEVICDVRDTEIIDVCKYIKKGSNILVIRAYQTADPESFTSALTGGIELKFDDRAERIISDNDFEVMYPGTFWLTDEPEGWLTNTDPMIGAKCYVVTDIHPIALRRSCYFAKDFDVEKDVKRATLIGSALGCYEAWVNGQRADDIFLVPSCMEKVREYQTYDVTDLISRGKNTIGAITGNGWYNGRSWGQLWANKPAVLLELEIEYVDGSKQTICTDTDWFATSSPYVENDLQFGERYDARLEIDDWCKPNCERSLWGFAGEIVPSELPLVEQNYPPIRAVKKHPVKYFGQLKTGEYMFDCGINIAGAVSIVLRNPQKGQHIFVSCCERLKDDGITPELGAYGAVFFQQDSLADGKAPYNRRNLSIYTAKGDEIEEYCPRFTYTGFRYIYIGGVDEKPDESNIFGVEMHNELEALGSFESSDKSLVRLWNAVCQTWKNNCYNGPTDCPTREKNFWNGDAQVFIHAACWIEDVCALLSRWTDCGMKTHAGPYGWEDEEYELAYTLYKFFGDINILKEKYPDMLELVKKRTEYDGMILPENPYSPYCDWLNPTGANLSADYFSSCWWLRMLDEVSVIAGILGDEATKNDLRQRFIVGREEFNRRHFDYSANEYDEKIQSAIVFPLAFNIAPDDRRVALADKLVEYIKRDGNALTTGFVATRYLMNVLADTGHEDIAIMLLHRKEFPSWNYMLDTGATNITESWFAMKDEDASISMSHFSLGAVVAWLFEYLGGIRVDDCTPGFEHVVFKPHFSKEVGDCKVSYKTAKGVIVSQWHYEGDAPMWSCSVPEGVTWEVME